MYEAQNATIWYTKTIMKKTYYIVGALVLIIIVLLALLLWPKPSNSPTTSTPLGAGTETPSPSTPAPSATKPTTQAGITYAPASAASQIKVDSPIVNATVHNTSPIKISGQAVGTWFFEATFPAKVLDAKGNVIGVGRVQSQGNWMTDSFVPFSGSVSYDNEPVGSHGYVVLLKDNPSSLPQNDATVTIPILFR